MLEEFILREVKQLMSTPENIRSVLVKIEQKAQSMYSDLPSKIRQKKRELSSEERKLSNFINFIGEGKGTISLNQALVDTENKIDSLKNEICFLQNSYSKVVQAPPIEWIEERLHHIQNLLERNIVRSAMVLRNLLGPIELEPVLPNACKPYYIAHTTFETISILEDKFAPSHEGIGANQFHWWTQTQLIRTLGSLPISITIIAPKVKPMYQQIANDCLHLHELGLSYYRIARKLNVDAKMVVKAINWIRKSHLRD